VIGPALAGAVARKALWRTVLSVTGGLRVHGTARLPGGPCVIVANHCSHADTAALIAVLPARRGPAVAAAADYWFRGAVRPRICRMLCAAFPVRRKGGGSADLSAAAQLLVAGHDVIIYPEGTRSRDDTTGDWHRGAARLAAAAGVPLVPVAISGTRTLLPPGGTAHRPRRAAVTVQVGAPVSVAAPAEHALGGGTPGRRAGAVPLRAGTAPGEADLARGLADMAGARDAVTDATAEARRRVVALVTGRGG
jgi:1-acyl-sn-glycerol-3-phosphate acyltransferase